MAELVVGGSTTTSSGSPNEISPSAVHTPTRTTFFYSNQTTHYPVDDRHAPLIYNFPPPQAHYVQPHPIQYGAYPHNQSHSHGGNKSLFHQSTGPFVAGRRYSRNSRYSVNRCLLDPESKPAPKVPQKTQVVYPDGRTVDVVLPSSESPVVKEMSTLQNGEDALDRLLEYGYRRINFLCQTMYPGFKLNKSLPGPPGPAPESPPPPVFVVTHPDHTR
ncbi:unnamed protein product [Bursaphelenchus xylophilus]|uniref:(pine wood nematode) hypothetical protein n=1 Tax=Bursaphelenchus xylophilus TaxID=6326 RepID=A0A1I7S4L9_BURXY|nr:unnamed protein product [Bursaphelenchus xylophilus]CAG9117229.1 unnamed protein product [Bursaphelenchus xylophilus]